MSVKLDISKAYDKMEWPFLEAMMSLLGFDEGWISKVMTCVMSVSYVVLVNDQPNQKIIPSKGLHQGDPISPYLYLFCAEGLSTLLHNVERTFKIKGVKMARSSLTINHLFFTDDSIIFCRATLGDWNGVQNILDTYEDVSEQEINKHKIGLFLSANTHPSIRGNILNLAGVSLCNN